MGSPGWRQQVDEFGVPGRGANTINVPRHTIHTPPPRYVPEREFPPYAYVPGRQPHPESDPAGHSYGKERPQPEPLDPKRPGDSPLFLFGVDLFNYGWYWEAHEAWEALWNAAGRTGPTATLLKGLIKLAAAGVKAREGNRAGVARHARRADELLSQLDGEFCGLSIHRLGEQSRDLSHSPRVDDAPTTEGKPVLAIELAPRLGAAATESAGEQQSAV